MISDYFKSGGSLLSYETNDGVLGMGAKNTVGDRTGEGIVIVGLGFIKHS
jgi:hypothetical protein